MKTTAISCLRLAAAAAFGLTLLGSGLAQAQSATPATPPAKEQKGAEKKGAEKKAKGASKEDKGRAHGMEQGQKKGMDHGQKKGHEKSPAGQSKKS